MLYTTENGNGYIAENASLSDLASADDATDFFKSEYEHSDFEIIGWEVRGFSDCWVKQFGEPDDENGIVKIDGIECYVKRPGQHPGRQGYYWLTPIQDVYVPILKEKSQQ